MDALRERIHVAADGLRHLPCVLLVDRSNGQRTGWANGALGSLSASVKGCPGQIELEIRSYADAVRRDLGFRPLPDYQAPLLAMNPGCRMNRAICGSLDALERRTSEYWAVGVPHYRGWLVLCAGDVPTDPDMAPAARARLQAAIRGGTVQFIPMSMGTAAVSCLKDCYPKEAAAKPVLCVDGEAALSAALHWAVRSMITASRTDPARRQIRSEPLPPGVLIL